ncbi:MAG: hypothetical protein FRX49_02106 [Trebouxia sp. A1-2]|nr:MAG: hypothetical protein FRX49_02106 [Trebouxia sp. A1-2]
MEFGFVSSQVVKELEEIGNWKARSAAVDKLYSALQRVQDKDVLLPTLSKLLRFLSILGEDANFKISLSTMQILADLALKLKADIRPYLGDIMPGLIDKLGDNKVAVRQANSKLLAVLMDVLQPGVVLDALSPALMHGNWRVREAAVNIIIQALLTHSEAEFDFPRIVSVLVRALHDDNPRVVTVAIEALAVVHHLIGDDIHALLVASGASVSSRLMLAGRFASTNLPGLKADGAVEHEVSADPQISLKGTQVSPYQKQSSLLSSPAKPQLANIPTKPQLTNTPAMPSRDGTTGGAGERAGVEGLGVIGVGAPGMPPAAAREPTAAALQRKTCGMRTGAAAAAASHDSSSAVIAEAVSVNYAAGSPHHETPVRRRPRAGDAAAAAAVRESSDLALSHFSIESGDNSSLGDAHDAGSVLSPGAGPQAFQLKWPLQPQPVNSAHSHLSNAAAKISAAADRYSSAVGTSKVPNAQATSGTITDRHSSPAGIGKAADGQSPPFGGIPAEGRRSSLSRRSNQSSAHSSTRSSDLGASVQSDPFASRPLLAHDIMEAGPSGRGGSQRGLAPTRRALFATRLQEADQWSVAASRNLDAPEMGSPPNSDDEEDDGDGDDSSSGSSTESSSPSESQAPASRAAPPSPFGVHKAVPRAHSAFVPTRTRALAESSLLSAESAPPTGLAVGSLGIPGLLDGDNQGPDSPKKAGRLQHLKMRVAEARKTVTAGAAFRPFPGDDWQNAGRKAGADSQPYGVGPLETCPPPGSPFADPAMPRAFSSEDAMTLPRSPPKQIAPRRKIRVTPPAEGYKEGLDAFSPSPFSPPTTSAPSTPCRSDIDSDSSIPATPSVSTPSRLRPLSSALEERASSLSSAASSDDVPSAQDLQPSNNPAGLLSTVLQQLQQANIAKRKELDWQTQNQALNGGRRLVAHHPGVLGPQLHSFVLLALPSVEALRSTTTKIGMLLLQEMFMNLRRGLDNELDNIVTVLAKRSGEVSVGGRDNFLAAESDKTIALMIDCCSETKVATALLAHVLHKSPQVRAKVASHLDSLMQGDHGMRLAGAGGQLEKVFKAAVGFLEEGSLDARTYGKRIIWQVKEMIRMEELKGMVGRVGGDAKQRKVWEVLDSASGPPPLPLKSAYSSRSPSSRQGLASPWGGSGLDLLPSAPSSPSTSSRPTALQTPPRSTRSPMAAKGVSVTVTDDMRSMPAPTSNCLLSEYNPFPPTPGSPGNLGGYGTGFGSGLGGGLLSPSSGGSERGSSKGLGRPGYAAKAGYGGVSGGTRDLSIAASRSRRRTSNSSDQTDNGRL